MEPFKKFEDLAGHIKSMWIPGFPWSSCRSRKKYQKINLLDHC